MPSLCFFFFFSCVNGLIYVLVCFGCVHSFNPVIIALAFLGVPGERHLEGEDGGAESRSTIAAVASAGELAARGRSGVGPGSRSIPPETARQTQCPRCSATLVVPSSIGNVGCRCGVHLRQVFLFFIFSASNICSDTVRERW